MRPADFKDLFGDTLWGDAPQEIVLKAIVATPSNGAVMWSEEGGFADFKDDLQASLPGNTSGEVSIAQPYGWVTDVSLDCKSCLICWNEPGSDADYYVSPVLTDGDGEPQVAPKEQWVEVEQQYVVAKAAVDPKAVAQVALQLDEMADKLLTMLGLQDDDADDKPAEPAAEPAEPKPPQKKGVAEQAGKVAKARAAAHLYLDSRK